MKNFIFLVVGLLLFSCTQTAEIKSDSKKSTKPNILLIMADDMGWTDLGCYGSEISTPNIDQLANTGVMFTDFHTSVSCSPTRSMLLTGTDNHIAGLGNMAELLKKEQVGKPGYEGRLNDRVVTIAEVLKDGGYYTYMAGKWHLGAEPEHYPHARGFERSFSMLDGGASHWSDMTGIQANKRVVRYSKDGKTLHQLPKDHYSSKSFADFLIEAMREDHGDGKPFFTYFALQAAHDPIHVPEPWLSKYRGQYDDGYEALKAERIASTKQLGLIPADPTPPPFHQSTKEWDSFSKEGKAHESRTMEAYAGLVDNMDYHVGRVINFLKDIGEYENTIIIFTVDNGPNPWYSAEYSANPGTDFMETFDNSLENIGHPGSNVSYGLGWAQASAGPLDYFKFTVGEGGMRTPLLIAGKGIQNDVKNNTFAYVMDIMPTILDFAKIDHPETYRGKEVAPMRGSSLAGVLTGKAKITHDETKVLGGEMLNGKWMRKGNYKAVLIAKPYGPNEWKLYDVDNDPGETKDLSKQQPELLEELRNAWDVYSTEVGVVLSE